MIKKIRLSLFLLLLVVNTSCISKMIKDSAKDTPVGNKLILHKSVRVGDYAVLTGAESRTQMRLKIVRKSGRNFVVSTETGVAAPGLDMLMGSVVIEMHVDRNGNVKKAYIIDGEEKTPLKVARPGQNQYMTPVRLTAAMKRKLGITSRITINGKTYKVTPLAFKNKDQQKNQLIVQLTNNQVKFRMVASYYFEINPDGSYTRHKGFELTEQGNKR